MPDISVIVVTPEATALEAEADFVALPLFDGEIGIAKHHSPMIGRLGYGEMRIKVGEKTDHYFLDGGFVQVVDNTVSVLTDRAIPAEQLDVTTATGQIADALHRKVNTPEALAIRDRELARARAQQRIALKMDS